MDQAEHTDERLFEITSRERGYLTDPENFEDLPFRYRKIGDRSVPFIPLKGTFVFHSGTTPVFSIKRHSRFQKFPEHCHDGIELNYLYAGSCHQIVNGRDIELREGQTLLLSSNTVHTILPLGERDILFNININPEFLISQVLGRLHCNTIVNQLFVESLKTSLTVDDFLLFTSQNNRKLRTYMEYMLDEWESPTPMARDITESLLVLLISELVLEYRQEDVFKGGSPVGAALPILSYLEEHYASCTLDETARVFHLNPTYLSNLLKDKIGLSYREIVQHLRLDVAERLLATTDLTVTEIARQVGYENVTFFYRIFERRCGCKPAEYRRRHE